MWQVKFLFFASGKELNGRQTAPEVFFVGLARSDEVLSEADKVDAIAVFDGFD